MSSLVQLVHFWGQGFGVLFIGCGCGRCIVCVCVCVCVCTYACCRGKVLAVSARTEFEAARDCDVRCGLGCFCCLRLPLCCCWASLRVAGCSIVNWLAVDAATNRTQKRSGACS